MRRFPRGRGWRVMIVLSTLLAAASFLASTLLWVDASNEREDLCRAVLPTAAIYQLVLNTPPDADERERAAESKQFRALMRHAIKQVNDLHCKPLGGGTPGAASRSGQ